MNDPAAIVDRLSALAREHSYLFSDIWARTRAEFGPRWVEEVADTVVRLFGPEEQGGWQAAVRGYAEFALDAMRNQKFFEKHGRYRWSTLAEIRRRYYEDPDHMLRNYLPGMYLSHYLWPHHFKLLTFFRSDVLGALQAPALFYDVGIGTGMYSREVLRAFPRARGTGFDISDYSVRFTRRTLQAYGVLDRYEFVVGDIFAGEPPPPADFVVSQEVLEHLEQPARFCEILHGMTREGGHAYVTAAVNAAHSDHIYLFRSPDEVHAMLEKAGWRVVRSRAEYAYQGAAVEITPCVAGFFCAR